MPFRFSVRPSYGPSAAPLIDMVMAADFDQRDRMVKATMRVVCDALGAAPSDHVSREELLHLAMTDERLVPLRFRGGLFEISADSWCFVFVLAMENADTIIPMIADALEADDAFERVPWSNG